MDDDRRESPELDERTRRDVVLLADGALGGPRRAALEARVGNSPELAAALRRQLAATTALRSLDLDPPQTLRERLAGERPTGKRHAPRPAPRRFAFASGLAAACAAALLLAVVLPSGGGDGSSLDEATQLANRPAVESLTATDSATPQLLPISGDGVRFPNLEEEFGWRAVGSRSDELDGREATTVFYESDERRIAYTILAGEAIEPPADSRTTRIKGVDFAAFDGEGMRAVTWQRQGRTCVLSGTSERELVELASWQGEGSVPF